MLTSLKRDDEFGNGVEWTRKSYTSDVLGKGSWEEGFAFALSDEIFADLSDYEEDRISRLKLGDIAYDEDGYVLGVVVGIDDDADYDQVKCATLDNDNEINWNVWVDYDDIDTFISRYP